MSSSYNDDKKCNHYFSFIFRTMGANRDETNSDAEPKDATETHNIDVKEAATTESAPTTPDNTNSNYSNNIKISTTNGVPGLDKTKSVDREIPLLVDTKTVKRFSPLWKQVKKKYKMKQESCYLL